MTKKNTYELTNETMELFNKQFRMITENCDLVHDFKRNELGYDEVDYFYLPLVERNEKNRVITICKNMDEYDIDPILEVITFKSLDCLFMVVMDHENKTIEYHKKKFGNSKRTSNISVNSFLKELEMFYNFTKREVTLLYEYKEYSEREMNEEFVNYCNNRVRKLA